MNDFARYVDARLNRHNGMGEDVQERLTMANEAATDWRGTCRKCGETLKGSLADMRGHKCDD